MICCLAHYNVSLFRQFSPLEFTSWRRCRAANFPSRHVFTQFSVFEILLIVRSHRSLSHGEGLFRLTCGVKTYDLFIAPLKSSSLWCQKKWRIKRKAQKGAISDCSQTCARHVCRWCSRNIDWVARLSRFTEMGKTTKRWKLKLCNLPSCLMFRCTVFLTPKMTRQSHFGIHPLRLKTYECRIHWFITFN